MKPILLDLQLRQEIERRRRQTHDKRIYARLSAILWSADGLSRYDIAELLGVGYRQIGEWSRLFRNKGLDALCTLHYKGDPGKLTAPQVQQLKEDITTGRFQSADQVRQWVEQTFHVTYTASGIKDLLHRIGASYHKVTGFFAKADPDAQRRFVQKYRRHKRQVQRAGVTKVQELPM
jgi:putative transposase